MAGFSVKIRNFLGVSKADFDLNGIVLVGGHNGAGKSSLLEAVSCAALQSARARGLTTNKAAAAVLKEGTEAGSVTLEYEGGAVRVIYPGCEIDQSGRPPSLGTALGIGSERFMALDAADRVKEITSRFQAQPTVDDLANWLLKQENFKPDLEAQKSIWERIEASGWDAVHDKAKEHGTKMKGAWEGITNRKWGSAIAAKWVPAPLLDGEDYDLEVETTDWQEAVADVEVKLQHAAVGAAKLQQLEEQAGDLAHLQGKLRGLIENGEALSAQADRLLEQRAVYAEVGEGPNYLRCPSCAATLKLVKDKTAQKLEAVTKHSTPAEVKEAIEAIKRIDGDRKAVAQEIAVNAGQQAQTRGQISTAEAARDALAAAKTTGTVTEDEVKAARDRMLLLERKVAAIKQMNSARKIHRQWENHMVIVKALAPDGVRATVLSRRLSEINATLGDLASLCKFKPVAIDDDFGASYDGRRYQLLSESEKWRVDLSLALLFGQQEHAPFLLIDRLDMLHNDARPGVLTALHKLGLPTLIACTAKDRDALPNLVKAKIGSVHWLTAGALD